MNLQASYNGKVISNRIRIANDLSSRLVGLMFRDSPKDAEGMLLEPCNSIHTFFMKYPLDVAFIDRKNKIHKIVRNLKPWRMTWLYFKSTKVLEMPAGKFPEDMKEGDTVEFKHV